MKDLKQDGPAGLSAARGLPVQAEWGTWGPRRLKGESGPRLELLQRVAEQFAGLSSAGLYNVCSAAAAAAGYMNSEPCADRQI